MIRQNSPQKTPMKTTFPARFAKLAAIVFVLSAALTGSWLRAEEQQDPTLLTRLKDSKHSLAAGIAQAEKENGVAISAKFEMDGQTLSLSVYTAKAGLGQDAEHNVLVELSGDAAQNPWKPETEVFADKEHLTRSATQLTLMQLSKLSLTEAIKKTEAAQPGTVYSITPAIKGDDTVFIVKVATAGGHSVTVTVDGESGESTR